MKFGKLDDITGVDFSVPQWPAESLALLPGKPDPGFGFYVGLSRWASKDWVGNLFPPKTKPADFLYHYARHFNTIELNTTHYRTPTPEQVVAWREVTPQGFRFCPKVNQTISHYRKLVGADEEIAAFARAIAHFGDRLGCTFLQLHDSFSPALLPNLYDFLQKWPAELPLAIEFRHAAWFAGQALIREATDALLRHGVSAVITDVSGRRDVLHTTLTQPLAMVRFVGNALHPTDYTRARVWMDRLDAARSAGLRDVYLFPHEPEDLMASDMGDFFFAEARERWGYAPQKPEPPKGQLGLF